MLWVNRFLANSTTKTGFEHLLKLVQAHWKVLFELHRSAGGAFYNGRQIYLFLWWVSYLICQKKSFFARFGRSFYWYKLSETLITDLQVLVRYYHVFWTEWCIAPRVGKPVWSRITCFDASTIHCYLPPFCFWIDTPNPSIISWASQ